MRAKAKKPFLSRPDVRLLLAGLAVVIVAVAVLEATNTTHIFHRPKAVSDVIKSTNPAASNHQSNSSSDNQPASNSSSTQTDKSTTAVSDSSAPLVPPYGSFVSNHRPSLSGSGGVPSQEQSVCTTTPGATCYIKFSQNGAVKTLSAQTTDSKGAAYWNWDVKASGFTTGSWTITAVAGLNGQTKSTTDSLDLVVNP
jgi:hypothetical protein